MPQPERLTRAERCTLAVTLALALALRTWGIGFGLPHQEARPDESVAIRIALQFLSGDPNPRFFHWPSLHMYVLAGLYGVHYIVGRALGWYGGLQEFLARWNADWAPFFLIARFYSAALGVMTVYLTFRIAQRLDGRTTGLVAAGFLAAAFLHVRESHFAMLDVPMTFLVMASILFLLRTSDDEQPGTFAIAGALCGFAVSTKYNALPLVAPALAAPFIPAQNAAAATRRVHPPFTLVVAFLIPFVAAFLAGTPYALGDWLRFVEDLQYDFTHLSGGHGFEVGRGWVAHLRISLLHGMGLPLLVAAIAGFGVLLRRRDRAAVVLGAFAIAYYVVTGSGSTVFARYALPLVPVLCVTAALVTCRVGSALAVRLRVVPGIAISALTVMLSVPSFVNAVRLDRVLGRTDTRVLAADWMVRHVPAGSSVAQTGSRWGALELPQANGFHVWTFDPARRMFLRDGRPTRDLPDWIVVERSRLRQYSRLPHELRQILDDRYQLAQRFEAGGLGSGANVFDQQDAFYVPLSGFHGVERPGPSIDLYRRR